MRRKIIVKVIGAWIAGSFVAAGILQRKAENSVFSADAMTPVRHRKMILYEKYIKRAFDIICASAALTFLSPLYLLIGGLIRFRLGKPVIFVQERPGIIGEDGKEKIFKMYKFRTMADERDEEGNLLPDDVRMSEFGKKLRASSLDELPEAINILNGTMSVIGPRPQLVKDMVFMSERQRQRHTAKPGLSGLAQVKGRNSVKWDDKLEWDLKYIEDISLKTDFRILWTTFKQILFHMNLNTDAEELKLAADYGDALLEEGKITKDEYICMQKKAKSILENR